MQLLTQDYTASTEALVEYEIVNDRMILTTEPLMRNLLGLDRLLDWQFENNEFVSYFDGRDYLQDTYVVGYTWERMARVPLWDGSFATVSVPVDGYVFHLTDDDLMELYTNGTVSVVLERL